MKTPGEGARGGLRYFAAFSLVVAALWTAIALTLDAAHERIVQRVTMDERNLARSLAENVASSLRVIDLSLLYLREIWLRDRANFPAIVARDIEFLKRESITQISVIDTGGRLVWSNIPGWRPLDLADREHYRVHKAGGDRLYISRPLLGRVSQKWTIQFTRPIVARDGKFAGVMTISVPPLALENIYNDIKLAAGGSIALVRSDGNFLARTQNFSEAAATSLNVETTPGLRAGDPVAGESRRINAIEKVESFVTYRKVPDYPAVVYVREPVRASLAGYYMQRNVFLSAGALFTAVLLWLTLVLVGKLRDKRQSDLNSGRLAALVDGANDAIISHDLEGRVTSWNRGAERLFGYTAAEAIGTVGLVTSPEFKAEVLLRRKQISEGLPVPDRDAERMTKDGRRIMVSISVSAIRDGHGALIGTSIVCRDIGERRLAEEARARLAAIIESASDAIIGRTPDGRVTSWNAAARRMFGYTIEEINGRADMLTPPDKLGESVSNRAAIKAGNAIEAYETVRVTKDGRRIDVLLSGSPIKNERGEIIGMANILRDITERKMIENTLRFLAQHSARNEVLELFQPLTRYLAGALQAEIVCIVRLQDDGASAKTLALFVDGEYRDDIVYALDGTPCAELLGRESIAYPAGVCALFPDDTELQKFGAESYAGVTLWGANGKPIGLISMMRRQPLEDGKLAEAILKLVAVRVEGELERELVVESLRRSEGELATLNAELEGIVERRTADLKVINEELESFSYSVAHDLRAPLRAIGGFSAMLLAANDARLDAISTGYLGRIKTNAERMAQLIDDLLTLTRVSRQQLHRIDFDLSAMAEKVIGALSEAQPQRRVELVIQAGMRVNADPGLVRALLENLIANAWKFTAKADPARIQIGCEARDGRTVYFVRDNGAGFDMRYAGKLFAPFQRLHGREEFEGTGIGLSIVRRVAMKHDGSVRAEGRVNLGATFYFTLDA